MKKILLIAPKTFGLYEHIITEFESKNVTVDFVCEHYDMLPVLIYKLMLKLPFKVKEFLHYLYFKNKIYCFSDYDLVLIIRGEFISERSLKVLKCKFNSSKFVMYQWDFEKNLNCLREQVKYFDKVYSFDRYDADKLNAIHMPLFYNNLFKRGEENGGDESISVSFVGTHHSDRYSFVKSFFEHNPELESSSFIALFRGRWSYWYNYFMHKNALEGANINEFALSALSQEEIVSVMKRSKFILDISQVDQNGLTLRTFEALGLKKKLITTNSDVRNYDFYNENNICVISRSDFKVPESFLISSYADIENGIYNKYSIDKWVDQFINEINN